MTEIYIYIYIFISRFHVPFSISSEFTFNADVRSQGRSYAIDTRCIVIGIQASRARGPRNFNGGPCDSSAYHERGLDIPRVRPACRLETIVIVLSEYTRIYAARLKTTIS